MRWYEHFCDAPHRGITGVPPAKCFFNAVNDQLLQLYTVTFWSGYRPEYLHDYVDPVIIEDNGDSIVGHTCFQCGRNAQQLREYHKKDFSSWPPTA